MSFKIFFPSMAIKPRNIWTSWIVLEATKIFLRLYQLEITSWKFCKKLTHFKVWAKNLLTEDLTETKKKVGKSFERLFLIRKFFKNFFVTAQSIHEVQILSDLMAKIESKSLMTSIIQETLQQYWLYTQIISQIGATPLWNIPSFFMTNAFLHTCK